MTLHNAPVRAVAAEDEQPEPGEIIQTPSGNIVIGVPTAMSDAESPVPSGGSN